MNTPRMLHDQPKKLSKVHWVSLSIIIIILILVSSMVFGLVKADTGQAMSIFTRELSLKA